ncbi:MAG: hypothetical protein M1838_001543 [Thelocarpon superellum]|nr:MAG: hypothetical protein M1838_001543 [Thelocarpon superellum]
MKEAIVHPIPVITVELQDVSIPLAGPDEIVIEVVAAGSNVKDWAHITAQKISVNSGDDMAGTIHSMGANVVATGELHIGDRVAAFHPMLTPGGAYAEFAVAPAHTVFIIPGHVTFEALTAALSLFCRQGLPPPWSPATTASGPIPLIIYGASSALGCFAIKLARIANIHPIIAVGGSSQAYVSTLLDASAGDKMVDYRHGVEPMIQSVGEALGDLKAHHALDAISANGTWIPLTRMLDTSGAGQISVVSGANAYDEAEDKPWIQIKYTYVGTGHYGAYKPGMPHQPEDKESVKADVEFAYLFYRYLARLLSRREFQGHPFQVIPGGLGGVQEGLQNLKDGKAKGVKYVYRIDETAGLGAGI